MNERENNAKRDLALAIRLYIFEVAQPHRRRALERLADQLEAEVVTFDAQSSTL
jgi:hypothetical protein